MVLAVPDVREALERQFAGAQTRDYVMLISEREICIEIWVLATGCRSFAT